MLTAFKEGRISIDELVNADRNDKLNVTLSDLLQQFYDRPIFRVF